MTKKILLIDNYDSFTYNLLHYLGELGADVDVVRNDQITADNAVSNKYDGIVISPGPGTPDDAGVCMDVVLKAAEKNKPLLGVCLGHQCIGQVFGGKVVRAPTPMHGKISRVHRRNKGIFTEFPSPFNATRYHSLIIERDSMPECLEIMAETDDRLIMAVQHKSKNIHGVQFHPESIASEYGHDLLKNFLNLIDGNGQ
ncbi:MAG: aminodeoxychorismate/anthranilate synthase component II [Alphaproteobacteria bacterium]|nr:aminodeoxychorismate/anthranilate synthase component II [Alphaproteobacteria bacterium]